MENSSSHLTSARGPETEAENEIVFWRWGTASHWQTKFYDLVAYSDTENLAKLEQVYPDRIAAYKAWWKGEFRVPDLSRE